MEGKEHLSTTNQQEKKDTPFKEYSFDEGVKETIRTIELLFNNQDVVVVAIAGQSGDDTNVGKTFLTNQISRECANRKISVVTASDTIVLPSRKDLVPIYKERGDSNKFIIILGAMSSPGKKSDQEYIERFRNNADLSVREAGLELGLPLNKIDIRVLIHRPDQGVKDGDRAYADIVINNEKANPKGPSKIGAER
ncbi:MAG TPA: hypothetical protein P5267_00275 [Patescibacteria group bacterium]|nr:hypothetical protein [Patescibacteria group bacterium]